MLRIIQNRSVAGAKSYYSHSDYYAEGQELAGRWGGLGAERLGLAGTIQPGQFEALCENRHPFTGEQLTPRNNIDRTVGYDFNFHIPKGISVAYMLTRDEGILAAFRASVDETMTELETEVKTRIRRHSRDDERVTGNLVWGEFIHLTARPVDGIPDPHLHAHCFVLNQTFDPEEQRWKAAQFRDIKRDAPYFQAAFYARFAKRLHDLGYPLARRGKQWDLAGLPASLAPKFSRRTQQVEEHAAEKGIQSAREKDQLGAKTRERKETHYTNTELRAIWRGRLSDGEQAALDNLREHTDAPPHMPDMPSLAMQHAIQHCFERQSVVPQREVLAEALRYGLGHVLPSQTEQAMQAAGVIVRNWGGRSLATTPLVLQEELSLLNFARQGRGRDQPLQPQWTIQRVWLNAGQQGAVRHVLESSDRVMIIKGLAGTGKTSLMQEAVEAINAGGHQVFTFAPSAEASRNVLREAGFEQATTVAELLTNEQLQAAAQGQVVWIDESGLLGTRQLKQIFDLAQRIDARVILSGDWRQHAAVERGAAMRLLEQEGGIKPAVVNAIQRQSGAYREAVQALATGHTERGFDQLDALGWIQAIETETLPDRVAKEYLDTLLEDKKAPLVVAPTHAEGERITSAIRQQLKAHQLLGADERSVPRLRPLNLTEAERVDPAMYEPGDVLVFHQHAPGYRKSQRVVLGTEIDPQLLKHARRFQAYRQGELPLAVGDLVRFTANSKTKDGRHRLNNGATYRLDGFTKSGDLRLANGWIVAQDHGFVAPGYTVTSHAAQGKTFEKVIVAESSESLAAASREQFYVSISRGKRRALVFTDDKAALREAVTRSSTRLAATELLAYAHQVVSRLRQLKPTVRQQPVRDPRALLQVEEPTHERA